MVRTNTSQSTSSSASSAGPIKTHGAAATQKVSVRNTQSWEEDGGYHDAGDVGPAAGTNATAAIEDSIPAL